MRHKMKPDSARMALVILVLALLASACADTATPAPQSGAPDTIALPAHRAEGMHLAQQPTPTVEGVTAEFSDLDISETDAENFEKRVDDIISGLVSADSDIDRTVLFDAYKELAKYKPVGGKWKGIGPAPIESANMPQGPIPSAGRVSGFAIDPRNSNVVYAAASFGGIWKTTDGGKTWKCLTDRQVPVVIGGIEIDPKKPDVLYALLGEFAPQLISQYGYLANGITRSRDAGKTWQLIGADTFNGAALSALVFDAQGNLYAASGLDQPFPGPKGRPDYGIFKSSDGGDTWERLASCGDRCTLPQYGIEDLAGGYQDLDIASDGTLYASLCSFFCEGTTIIRSRDGGKTWKELGFMKAVQQWEKKAKASVQKSQYTGEINIRGIELAVARSNPKLVIAGVGLYANFQSGPDWLKTWALVLRSRDGGDTWEYLPGAQPHCVANGMNNQCSYDNVVEIDPTDPDIMYLGGSLTMNLKTGEWTHIVQRSDDGGKTWEDTNPATSESAWMHPDAHGLAIDPNDHNVVWVGTDGGIYRTKDARANPPVWEHMSRGIDTLLFIDIGLHPTDRNTIIGGLQDNGMALTNDLGKTWPGASQGDNGHSAFDPFDPAVVYSTWPQGEFARNDFAGKGGYKSGWEPYTEGLDRSDFWLFYAPMMVDPSNKGVVYFASNRVYKSTDQGDTWKPVSKFLGRTSSVQGLAISPTDPNTLYAGMTDGRIWYTTGADTKWTQSRSRNLPPRTVSRIAAHPNDPQMAVAVYGSFNVASPDKPGHVFITNDGGKTWQDISYNLPDAPVGAVVIDVRPKYAGIYIGGSLGVWVLREGSQQWLPYGTGIPYVLVTDMELNPKTGIMAVSTYGRSIWVMEMP